MFGLEDLDRQENRPPLPIVTKAHEQFPMLAHCACHTLSYRDNDIGNATTLRASTGEMLATMFLKSNAFFS